MQFGARIIKTGIAVAITMAICKALNFEPAFFGAVSAVINMQPSIFLTIRTARDQIFIHIIGVTAGFLFGYFIGVNALSAGLIAILLISLYIKLNLQSGITMGIVAALFVLSSSADEFLAHAFARTAVIFTGLGTAMTINILLWPPRYSERFKEILKESNEEAVRYFCRAVQDYVRLENEETSPNIKQRENVYKLNKEVRWLAELSGREQGVIKGSPAEQNLWFSLAEKLIDYNESITRKGDRIYDLLPVRLERRQKSGAPPISDEFKAILEILDNGCTTILRINGKLRDVVIYGSSAEPEEINEDYWERLTKAIELWQPKLTGSYYLHGLIEAAVTANEIKWAARQAKSLLQESMENMRL